MGTLFGTDGIRGVANRYPITCEVALKTGQAVGLFVKDLGYSAVVIGKDTRISGDMLESAIAAGVASTGITAMMAGVIPTPGVAFLCSDIEEAGAGIVLSASHNPYQDNGIKIFKHGGVKLSDEQEAQIEAYILNNADPPDSEVAGIISVPDSLDRYARFLLDTFPEHKRGINPETNIDKSIKKKLRLIIDCSNGAASRISKMVFNSDLFESHFIYNSPNGININDDCGSQHTQDLQVLVTEQRADIGLAFDGDADRLIAVDENGCIITGDCILAICAKFLKEKNRLDNDIVVSTIMSNAGLTECLDRLGITHIKAGVGDRKVLEQMVQSQAVLGGEDSGHMIFLNDHSTGDGMLSALRLLEVMIETGESLSSLAAVMTVYPQILKNVFVDASRPDFTQIKPIADTIASVKGRLGTKGRVLIRYSGTQPLLRVMVEGPDQALIELYCDQICDSIKANI
ncbi:MAG: phosphoglucosamine mutase [Pseudomonadota bacterium]